MQKTMYNDLESSSSRGCTQNEKNDSSNKDGSISKNIVLEAMRWHLSQSVADYRLEPFCVMDLGYLVTRYEVWRHSLPSVMPFYAVKCNPDIHIIRLLGSLGCGFDCASRTEIELVLAQGISPRDIIFANPCKKIPDIIYAYEAGVSQMTFDNRAELNKIHQWFPTAQLILRCFACDPSATYSFASKFGASPQVAMKLLQDAKDLNMAITGTSFHVGSDAKDPRAFDAAIRNALHVFREARKIGHDKMHLLDIGGGFTEQAFAQTAVSIQRSLDQHFGNLDGVAVVAEPGRYFAAGTTTLACSIIARRDATENMPDEGSQEPCHMLYLNDGIYGTFLSNIWEPASQPQVLRASGQFYPPVSPNQDEKHILWGPTCDGVDCILKSVDLPKQLAINDWLYFDNMGAYTTCLATAFNGFDTRRETLYVSTHPTADAYLQKRLHGGQCRDAAGGFSLS